MSTIELHITRSDKEKFCKLQKDLGMSFQDLLKWIFHIGLKHADKEKMEVA